MRCPLLELCKYCGSEGWLFCIQLTLAIVTIILGTLVLWNPKRIIEIQIALYRRCNWKLEPISMEKEIRNTRIMGAVTLILGIASLVYIIIA